MNLIQKLASRIAKNKTLVRVSDEKAAAMLNEYLDEKKPTSLRKLSAKHKVSVGAVSRALKRAAEAKQ